MPASVNSIYTENVTTGEDHDVAHAHVEHGDPLVAPRSYHLYLPIVFLLLELLELLLLLHIVCRGYYQYDHHLKTN